MTSQDSKLEMIATELKSLSIKRQELLERKKMKSIFQELKNRIEFRQTEGAVAYDHEIDSIDADLKHLTEKKQKLQESQENILNAKDEKYSKKEASFTPSEITVPAEPEPKIFYVEPPPNVPAPTVILDVEKLPPCPCRTQCPECKKFIITETSTSVSSVTWLVCFMTALMGCVAGCCLIPFCVDRCKSTIHKCPNCRTSIRVVKQL
ncbi:hypothetical protein ABVT39_009679 [Epinephelus coioides]